MSRVIKKSWTPERMKAVYGMVFKDKLQTDQLGEGCDPFGKDTGWYYKIATEKGVFNSRVIKAIEEGGI